MLQPWGVLKLLELARITCWFDSQEPYMDFDQMHRLIFMASASLQIKPQVYDVELEKRPITVDLELDYVGKTSLKLANKVFFPGHSEPLVLSEMQIVLVDMETKKPAPPPQWWTDKFSREVNGSGKPLILPSTPVPTDGQMAEVEVLVLPSDVDPYVHASSAQYIKYVVEAYVRWHIKEYGYVNNGDPFRNLKSMCQSFKGEASIGDLLKVKFWPSPENQDLFHFHFLKGQNLIHECVAEFYPLEK
ncbi:uncharacterized protein LOC101846141 isoform X2 [Aplysia californica]|nr:uncharacterized protein LOC101846141 isoform X2 [Aplysia californica]